MTDISNSPFPSSLQNTETRYFVLWAGKLNKIQTDFSWYGSINAVAKHSVTGFWEFLNPIRTWQD